MMLASRQQYLPSNVTAYLSLCENCFNNFDPATCGGCQNAYRFTNGELPSGPVNDIYLIETPILIALIAACVAWQFGRRLAPAPSRAQYWNNCIYRLALFSALVYFALVLLNSILVAADAISFVGYETFFVVLLTANFATVLLALQVLASMMHASGRAHTARRGRIWSGFVMGVLVLCAGAEIGFAVADAATANGNSSDWNPLVGGGMTIFVDLSFQSLTLCFIYAAAIRSINTKARPWNKRRLSLRVAAAVFAYSITWIVTEGVAVANWYNSPNTITFPTTALNAMPFITDALLCLILVLMHFMLDGSELGEEVPETRDAVEEPGPAYSLDDLTPDDEVPPPYSK